MKNQDLILYFKSTYPTLYRQMVETMHSENDVPNSYHLEGSIMTHTEMVLMNIPEDKSNTLKVAALLHDIGKVYTREVDVNNIVAFKKHDKRGSIEAIDIVKNINKYFGNVNISDVVNLINLHHIFFNYINNPTERSTRRNIKRLSGFSPEFLSDLSNLCISDANGRYTLNDNTKEINKLKHAIVYIVTNIACSIYQSEVSKTGNKCTIDILIGLPYSGKTTFLNNNKLYDNYCIISRDYLVMNLRSNKNMNYNEAWDTVDHNRVNYLLFESLNYLYKERKNIVVDMTNLSVKSRNKILGNCPPEYKKKAIVFLTGLSDINNRRNTRTDKVIDSSVINDMSNRFSVPTYLQFDEIEYIL